MKKEIFSSLKQKNRKGQSLPLLFSKTKQSGIIFASCESRYHLIENKMKAMRALIGYNPTFRQWID